MSVTVLNNFLVEFLVSDWVTYLLHPKVVPVCQLEPCECAGQLQIKLVIHIYGVPGLF